MNAMAAIGYDVEHRPPPARGTDRARSAPSRPAPVIGTLADLRRKVFPPIKFVVPNYIAEGCTILAGRPKLGKSWLMFDVAIAVATGDACLGNIACEQGDALYLALEDNERRLQKRADKLLGSFGIEWPARLEYATEWPRAGDGGVEKIRDWIEAAEAPRLVIVDVLARFRSARGDRDSLYDADYRAVAELQALAGETGVAIVIVHHVRKSAAESDPFEKVSGTLGLSGAADTVLILDRDGHGATLYGRGRDIEEVETAVVFDRPSCRWSVLGEASEVRRTDERGSILAALEDADEPMSPTDIADATKMPNQNIRQLLVRMVKAGEVVKAKRGLYVHPDNVTDCDLVRGRSPRHNDHKITNDDDAEEDCS